MKSKILAVDNETDILEILSFNLKNEGYEVFTASNGLEAIEKTKKNLPDLILLDIMMEGMDGIEVCRNLKEDKATRNIPIIFLSAKGEELDKILGLELGADDYITKPFSVRELVSRVKALLRRTKKANDSNEDASLIKHEDLMLNLDSKRLFIDDKQIPLTKKEYRIAHLFLSNPGKVFSRDRIIEYSWDEETYIIDRAVDVHIRRLRKKLGKYSEIIITYPGMGYGYKI